MENTILNNLLNTKNILKENHHNKYTVIKDDFNKKAYDVLVNLDPMFKDWIVDVNDSNIELKPPTRFSGFVGINFPYYKEPVVKWSSGDSESEIECTAGIMIGILCKENKLKSETWGELICIFRNRKTEMEKNVDPIYNSIWEIERQITKVKEEERNNYLETLFNKGELSYENNIRFQYGNKRYDYVLGKNWKWEINKGGKTLTLIVDGMDLHKRVKINDFKYWLKHK